MPTRKDVLDKSSPGSGEPYLKQKLPEYGLDFDVMLNAWYRSANPRDYGHATLSNWGYLKTIEKYRPGGSSLLVNEFKLKNFSRYTGGILLDQIDQYKNSEMPYGVVFFPEADWLNTFYSRGEVYETFRKQLKRFDPQVGLRFFEVNSFWGMLRTILWCDQKYGQNGNKIAFANIAGHADKTSLNFRNIDGISSWLDGERLKTLRLSESPSYHKLKDRLMNCFAPNPTFILDACSTGAPDGLAQELSFLGADVFGATRKWTNVKAFNPTQTRSGKIRFDVRYTNRSPRAVYDRGMLVRLLPNSYLSSRQVSGPPIVLGL